MKNKVMSAAAVLLFSTAGISWVVAQSKPEPAAPAQPSGPWEYTTLRNSVSSPTAFERELNRLGADGWELCLFDETRSVWVFKRPQR
ncbi:hypothetical protein HAHE_13550 [Haloferula helveola]|uniref:DUF4177 domain-containing protein n=1 Tax=Haloferula helveola TaxID=490095 RepID=A0ABM7RBJ5_9BACT|nr:hypothetical protein HAHE_13550 [Haloferula helveola]